MVSINNTASASILANLRQINNEMAATQIRIGTGKKVNAASDNASVWAIAQGIRSDIKGQEGATSTMAIAKGKSDSAVAGLNTAIDLLGQIKTIANDAIASGSGFANAANKVAALKTQITAALGAATFQGENWLTETGATKTVNIGMSGGTAQTVSVTTTEVDLAGTGTITVFNAIAAISDATTADAVADGVDTAVTALSAYQATLSTFSGSLSTQIDFQKTIQSIRETALSSLVDADLEEESAKSAALQVKQQLAYQALAIGNSSSQNVLLLFR